jgi:hypothetical protein
MKPRVFLAKLGRRWFRDRPKSALFVRDKFRKWCADDELLTHTLEGFKMRVAPRLHPFAIYFLATTTR